MGKQIMAGLALAQYGSGAFITAVLHPFGYAKVLMQMGHEPLSPEVSTTFYYRTQSLTYPNIFKYIGHIKQVDGFWGLYRGVFPRVLAGTLGNLVQYNIQDQFKSMKKQDESALHEEREPEDLVPWLKKFAKETSEDSIGRCCGVIVSHPFHVIMVRSMVQFVGRETQYNTVISSIREIYNQDGILGFFAGLIPRLIGEVFTIWLTTFLAQAINRYVIQEKDMKSYTGAACGLVVSHFTYPFTLVANVMTVNNCGLRAAQPPLMPVYNGWAECMSQLSAEGSLKRGAAAFWRPVKVAGGPQLMRYNPNSRLSML